MTTRVVMKTTPEASPVRLVTVVVAASLPVTEEVVKEEVVNEDVVNEDVVAVLDVVPEEVVVVVVKAGFTKGAKGLKGQEVLQRPPEVNPPLAQAVLPEPGQLIQLMAPLDPV